MKEAEIMAIRIICIQAPKGIRSILRAIQRKKDA